MLRNHRKKEGVGAPVPPTGAFERMTMAVPAQQLPLQPQLFLQPQNFLRKVSRSSIWAGWAGKRPISCRSWRRCREGGKQHEARSPAHTWPLQWWPQWDQSLLRKHAIDAGRRDILA